MTHHPYNGLGRLGTLFCLTACSLMPAFARHSATTGAALSELTEQDSTELTPAQNELDEVVVSANRLATLRRLAPAVVGTVSAQTLETTHALCLAEGLNFQPGLRVEDNCQNCGLTQVRINGLDGHYSQILLDSRPVFSALSSVYGLEQIPASMIERIEVVRGGGSALFGGSAVGGTVNVITREASHNGASFGHDITAIGGFGTFDNTTSLDASVVSSDGRAGLCLYGQNRYRQGYDASGDGYTELPLLRNRAVGVNGFLRLSPYSRIKLEYHTISDEHRGGNLLNLAPHEANISEGASHDVNGGGLTYDLTTPDARRRLSAYAAFQNTDRDSYYGGTGDGSEESAADALLAYGNTHDLTLVAGAQYTYAFRRLLFLPADLTLGGEYSFDDLHDNIEGYSHHLHQTVRTGSAFLQNEWKNERVGLLVGLRMDKHNLIDHAILSPRANLRFNPSKAITLRAGYARGFRAPQAYDEDLHVSLVGGERLVTRLAENLKPEYSNSLTLSADATHSFGRLQASLLVEGFYTQLKNVFALRTISGTDEQGNAVQERYNAYKAHVAGVNIEGRATLPGWFDWQMGLTLQQAHYSEPVLWNDDAAPERKMMRTPNVYGYFAADFTRIERLTLSLSGNYTGRMLVGHEAGSGTDEPTAVNTPRYFTLNVKVAYDFPLGDSATLQVNAGVRNVGNAFQKDFDNGYDRDSGYIYGPSLPRSYFAGLRVTI